MEKLANSNEEAVTVAANDLQSEKTSSDDSLKGDDATCESSTEMPNWTLLPIELLEMIFKFLDALSLVHVGNVCPNWKSGVEASSEDNKFEKGFAKYWGPQFRDFYPRMDYEMFSSLVDSLNAPNLAGLSNFQTPEGGAIEPLDKDSQFYNRDASVRLAIRHLIIENDWWPQPKDLEMCFAHPSQDNFLVWIVRMEGPLDSPYEDGIFYLKIRYPTIYPFTAPRVTFLTKIIHPAITSDGEILMDYGADWCERLTTKKLVLSILSLLTESKFEDCCEATPIGKLYKENRTEFNELARAWTKKYAQQHLN